MSPFLFLQVNSCCGFILFSHFLLIIVYKKEGDVIFWLKTELKGFYPEEGWPTFLRGVFW